MRRWSFFALVLHVAMGCGGGDEGGRLDPRPDGGIDDGGLTTPSASPVSPSPAPTTTPRATTPPPTTPPPTTPPPTTPPTATPDGGMGDPDGGMGDPDGGMDGGGEEVVFVEEYTDRSRVDEAATNALVTTAGDGSVSVAVPEMRASTGSDGPFRPGSGLRTLAAGDHHFTAVEIPANAIVEAVGAVAILALGHVTIDGQINAGPEGLLIASSGNVTLGPLASIASEGPVEIQLLDTRSLLTAQGMIATVDRTSGDSPAIRIYARGEARLLDADIVTGDAAGAGTSGAVRIWSGRRLVISAGAYIASGRNETGGRTGDVELRSADEIEISGRTEVTSGDAHGESGVSGRLSVVSALAVNLTGTDVESGALVHSGDGIDGADSGEVHVQPGTSLLLDHVSRLSAGDVDSGTSGRLRVFARGLRLNDRSVVAGGNSRRGAVGPVEVRVVGDAELHASSFLQGGNNTCARAGALLVEVSGDLEVEGRSAVRGGASTQAMGCAGRGTGGDLTLRVGGAVTANELDILAGSGDPEGARTFQVGSPVIVTLPPPETRVVQSVALDTGVAGPQYLEARPFTTAFPVGSTLLLELSSAASAGGPYSAWTQDVTAVDGGRWFRFRLTLGAPLFESPVVDRVEIRYRR